MVYMVRYIEKHVLEHEFMIQIFLIFFVDSEKISNFNSFCNIPLWIGYISKTVGDRSEMHIDAYNVFL